MGKRTTQYPYSTELKKPYHYGETNFENPFILRFMKLVLWHMRVLAKSYMDEQEAGVQKAMIQIPVGAGVDIPCFLIEPADCADALPAIIYLHGGAFFAPVQRVMLRDAVLYARELRCRIFMPEYRLTPKYPFPVALEDSYATLLHVAEQAQSLPVDPSRIILYGDSAGGTLAAALTHLIRDRKGPAVAGQVLIYPVTDHLMSFPSMETYKDAVWSRTANRHAWNLYLANGVWDMLRYASPLYNDTFAGLPPAYVEPQEIDTLRDEAVAYAEKLKAAGVPTEVNIIPGSYHGFDDDRESPLVKWVLQHRKQVIRRMFESGSVRVLHPEIEL